MLNDRNPILKIVVWIEQKKWSTRQKKPPLRFSTQDSISGTREWKVPQPPQYFFFLEESVDMISQLVGAKFSMFLSPCIGTLEIDHATVHFVAMKEGKL